MRSAIVSLNGANRRNPLPGAAARLDTHSAPQSLRPRSDQGECSMKLPSMAALISASFMVALPTLPAGAHPGGLNSEGCHNNRKTGGYHCHRGPSASPSRALGAVSSSSRREFANCSQARAAGAAPVRRGDPGYGPHLDRDDDGVGCE